MIRCFTLSMLMLLVSGTASTQTTYGVIEESISDAAWGALAGATVAVIQRNSDIVSTVESNELGLHRALDLNPGQYNVVIELRGFERMTRPAFVDFSVAPAYYQTMWFRTASVVAVLAVFWTWYQFRLRQIAHAYKQRLDERVNERTRIARELHDTLLQSFQGLVLRFQSARNLLPTDPAQAVEALDGALDRADQAIVEGRDAIQNLRSSTTVTNQLPQAIAALADEFADGPDRDRRSPTFRVSVEGTLRDLHPILRDDVYRIAREALRNAFCHAEASRIEAEITYSERHLRLRIRDDGKGMDPRHLNAGRAGHWGLIGMRERATHVGAQLSLWSEIGAGTEMELCIPGAIAYGTSGGPRQLPANLPAR